MEEKFKEHIEYYKRNPIKYTERYLGVKLNVMQKIYLSIDMKIKEYKKKRINKIWLREVKVK